MESPFFETLGSIFGHVYFWALYGVAFYYMLIYNIEAEITKGKDHKRTISWQSWRRENMGMFLLTAMAVPLLIVWDDEIIGLYNSFAEKDLPSEFATVIYVLAGPIVEFVVRYFGKWRRNKLKTTQL